MSKDKIQMPASQGGLVRYFDEYKSKFTLKPVHVIIFIIIIIVLLIALNALAPKIV